MPCSVRDTLTRPQCVVTEIYISRASVFQLAALLSWECKQMLPGSSAVGRGPRVRPARGPHTDKSSQGLRNSGMRSPKL